MGEQLHAHANGVDRSFLDDMQSSKEKSIGNSQVLPRDYSKQRDIDIVLTKIVDQVAARLRKQSLQTKCISFYVGYSKGFIDKKGKTGFSQQLKIPPTNNTKILTRELLAMFRHYYN